MESADFNLASSNISYYDISNISMSVPVCVVMLVTLAYCIMATASKGPEGWVEQLFFTNVSVTT